MLRCQHPQRDTHWNRRRENLHQEPGEWRTLRVPGDMDYFWTRGFKCMCVCALYVYIYMSTALLCMWHRSGIGIMPPGPWRAIYHGGGEACGTSLQHAVGMAGNGILRNARSSDGSGGQSVWRRQMAGLAWCQRWWCCMTARC